MEQDHQVEKEAIHIFNEHDKEAGSSGRKRNLRQVGGIGGHGVTLTGLLYGEFVGSGMSGVTLSHVANFLHPCAWLAYRSPKIVNRCRVGILWTLKSGSVQ